MEIRAAILTVSDKASRGERQDTSGAAIRELLATVGASVGRHEVVPDEREQIAEKLSSWADEGAFDIVLTTGGTGPGPRDVTPEATLAVAHRVVPGIAEAMRLEGMKHTPMAMLSRATAVLRGRTLIVNLPGSEKGVRENLGCLLPVLAHAVDGVRGKAGDHVATRAGVKKT